MVIAGTASAGVFNPFGFRCYARFDFYKPDLVNLVKGQEYTYQAKINNTLCGATHAFIVLKGIPKEWYNITPAYHRVLIPRRNYEYNITLKIPKNETGKEFLFDYWVYAQDHGQIISTVHDKGNTTVKIN